MFAGSRYRKGTLGDVDAENPGVWWLRALALVLATVVVSATARMVALVHRGGLVIIVPAAPGIDGVPGIAVRAYSLPDGSERTPPVSTLWGRVASSALRDIVVLLPWLSGQHVALGAVRDVVVTFPLVRDGADGHLPHPSRRTFSAYWLAASWRCLCIFSRVHCSSRVAGGGRPSSRATAATTFWLAWMKSAGALPSLAIC